MIIDNNAITATINWGSGESNTIASNRKENNYIGQYTLLDKNTCEVWAELRLYATPSRHYACFWLFGRKNGCISGGAYAGGYGYHRASAAAGAAIKRAGITLSDSISGVGDSAIKEALKAIGVACGINPVVIDSHA